MDAKDNTCPQCGSTQLREGLVCAVCGEELTPLMEHTTRFLQPHAPAHSRHRRLFVGLVLGGLGLAGVGSCLVGPALLRGALNTLSTPASLPVDKHRVLNFPLTTPTLLDWTWLPDNRHILGFDYPNFFLLDVKGGKTVWLQPSSFPSSSETSLFWSSDRRYVAEVGTLNSAGPDAQLQAVVRDLSLRRQVWTSPSLGGDWHPCALAPSGASFALCPDIGDSFNDDGSITVQIWDIQHNRLLTTWNVQNAPNVQSTPSVQEQTGSFAITTMIWSPDSTRLALTCTDGSVQVWDAASSSCLWTYYVANLQAASLQWSPDRSALAVYLSNETTPPIEMLDTHTGKLLFQTSALDFSRFDVNGMSQDIAAESSSLLWSSDGTRLALLTCDYYDYERVRCDVQVCDARTGQHLFTYQHVEGQLTGCSWSPDGRYLAAGVIGGSSQDGTFGEGSTIQFWDAQSGKVLFSYQAPKAPSRLIWSADSRFLATYNPQSYGQVGFHEYFSNFALQVFEVA